MNELIEISWTAGSLDEARKISRLLVKERLVACAQIIPWIESLYMWNEELETSQESKIVLKSSIKNFEKVKKIIEDNCHYEVPEIIYHKIEGGNSVYFEWMQKTMS